MLMIDKHDTRFQQDGATAHGAHTAYSTMEMLNEFFGEHVISTYIELSIHAAYYCLTLYLAIGLIIKKHE